MDSSEGKTTVHRKPNGAEYLYSRESYWDKEKKAPRSRQVCLGRIDGATGDVIPSKRRARKEKPDAGVVSPPEGATTKVYGPHLLLAKVAEDTGLAWALARSMPDECDEILSLAFFAAQKGLPLSRCEAWSESHHHPLGRRIASQRVSELLARVTEDDRQGFLSLWMDRLLEDEMLCYDITSVSSHAAANEYVRWGHNRDDERLPQINLAVLYGQESGMPAYYRRLPGNITDVVTLDTTVDALDMLGVRGLRLVLDRGFYSEDNVDLLLDRRYRFILMTRADRLWVRGIIDQYHEGMASPGRYRQTGEGEALYMVRHPFKWGAAGRRCYAHIYYNAARAAEDFDDLTRELVVCKAELEAREPVEAHKTLYERFLIVRDTPKRGRSVTYNDAEIQKHRKRYAGYFCILTNIKYESDELLATYRRKDVVENCFDDLKNGLDMRRLRVHSSPSMDTRLFIQFLALILLSGIRKALRGDKDLRYKSPREVMEAMETIVRVTSTDSRWDLFTEVGPLQQKIVDLFDLSTET